MNATIHAKPAYRALTASSCIFTKATPWVNNPRAEAPCEGTNPPRLFTPGETKALAKSKVHQWAWLTNDVSVGGHPHWSKKYGGLSWIADTDWSNLSLHYNDCMTTAKSQNKVHRRPTSWFFLWFSYDFGVTRNSSSNADAMVLASARLRGIYPPDIIQNGGHPGGNASQTRNG
jgi:hypothetical protein